MEKVRAKLYLRSMTQGNYGISISKLIAFWVGSTELPVPKDTIMSVELGGSFIEDHIDEIYEYLCNLSNSLSKQNFTS